MIKVKLKSFISSFRFAAMKFLSSMVQSLYSKLHYNTALDISRSLFFCYENDHLPIVPL